MNFPVRRIRPLSPELANQIAAGEVVERPASVVKELVENCLDAGAGEIHVDVEEGGVRLIRVRDNGAGIHRDDLSLALSPHATSKVQSARDLLGILSLGFRGEALASIASVSRLTLTSRTAGDDSAWCVTGAAGAPVPAAHPQGTTVEVRDLFHNVPARRKFLRAERTEYEHVEETVRRLALGCFDAGFSLKHNGRTIFGFSPAADTAARERRVSALVGRAFLEHAVALSFDVAGLRLTGWIGVRGYSRNHADVQYVYLNGRVIRDRVINHALRQAYGEGLMEGRFPAYVLYLEMDPAQVDVNVHPTKHEVRFREARLVHDFLVSALRGAQEEALRGSELLVRDSARSQDPVRRADPPTVRSSEPVAAVKERKAKPPPEARPLGLVGRRFLLAEGQQGLMLVDALRLIQAEVRQALGAESGPLASRPLLMPITVTVSAELADGVEIHGAALARWGMDVTRVGAVSVRVRAVPQLPAPARIDVEKCMPMFLGALVLDGGDSACIGALVDATHLPAESECDLVALLARAEGRPGFSSNWDLERLAKLIMGG